MNSFILPGSQRVNHIGSSNRPNPTQQIAVRNEEPVISEKGLQAQSQRRNLHIAIQKLESTSSNNQATELRYSNYRGKAWVKAGLVAGTTALVYGIVKGLGYCSGWLGSSLHNKNNGIQTDREVVRDHRQATDVPTAVQHGQKIIARHVDQAQATGQDLSLRKWENSAFEELEISDVYEPKDARDPESDLLMIHTMDINRTTHYLRLSQGPTILNPIPDQCISSGENLNLRLGNDRRFPNPGVDVFDGHGHRLRLSTTISNGNPLPEGLSLYETMRNLRQMRGLANTPGFARDVFVMGSTAFVADRDGGLQMIDVSDRYEPFIIGSINTPGSAEDVVVIGNNAFVADESSGLQVIDISNPSDPYIIGSVNTPGAAVGIAVVDSTVFVADDRRGLKIIDASNPAEPFIIGSVNTPGSAEEVVVVGNTAFVADKNGGLQIINVSNPAAPFIVGSLDTPGDVHSVAVVDNFAFVADDMIGLQMIDVSNPSAPFIVETNSEFGPLISPFNRITVIGNIVFLSEENSLVLIDVSDPGRFSIFEQFRTPGLVYGIAVADYTVFLADGSAGLQIIEPGFKGYGLRGTPFDLTDKKHFDVRVTATPDFSLLVGIASYWLRGPARSIAVAENTAFVGTERGLEMIDVSNLSNPFIAGQISSLNVVRDITVVGNIAFVVYDSALQMIDVSNLSGPFIAGTVTMPGSAGGVAVVGNTAFIADKNDGLQIINVSNPAAPFIVGSLDTPGDPLGIAVAGNTAFVADRTSGLQIIDVSNPVDPFIIGSFETPSAASDIAVVGNTAFVTCGYSERFSGDRVYSGLQIIDVSNPSYPILVGSVNTVGNSPGTKLTVVDNTAFVADVYYDLQIIDISNLSAPTVIGTFTGGFGPIHDVAVEGSTAFVANAIRGLQLIDLTPIYRFGGSASDTFRLSVCPDRSGRKYLAAMIAVPLISAAGIAIVLYKKPGLFMNPFKGKEASQTIMTGRHYDEIFTFAAPSNKIQSVIAKIPDRGCFSSLYQRFGKTKMRSLPEGLPRGLRYDHRTKTVSGSPESEGVFTLQAIGKGGVIREQFDLTIGKEEKSIDTWDLDDNKEPEDHEETEMTGYLHNVGIVPGIGSRVVS